MDRLVCERGNFVTEFLRTLLLCIAMFVYYNGKMSVRLSVTRVVFAQTATATAFINGLLESMFHLVSEKLTLVDGGHP